MGCNSKRHGEKEDHAQILFLKIFITFIYLILIVCEVCVHAHVHVWWSLDNLQPLTPFLLCVGPRESMSYHYVWQ